MTRASRRDRKATLGGAVAASLVAAERDRAERAAQIEESRTDRAEPEPEAQ